MKNKLELITALLGSLTTACVTDTADETDLGETGQEATVLQYAGVDALYYAPQSLTITSQPGAACFLDGVGASISSQVAGEHTTAGVTFHPAVGRLSARFSLDAYAGDYRTRASAACVAASHLTPEVFAVTSATTQHAHVKLADYAANRRCFITKISTTAPGAFNSELDNAYIGHDANDWYLDLSLFGNAVVTARCLNINQDLGTTFIWSVSAPASIEVPFSDDSVCLLSQVAGKIASYDPAIGLGVMHIQTQIDGPFHRFLNAQGGNGGRFTCVKPSAWAIIGVPNAASD